MSPSGVTVTTEDERGPQGLSLTLGTQFVIVETEKGPEVPTSITNYAQFKRVYGEPGVDYVPAHNWVEAWFREGGGRIYVQRLLGAAATAADLDLSDGSTVALTATALYRGAWGDRVSVDIDVASSNFTAKVYLDDVLKETSPTLADGPAAAAWSQTSAYLRFTDGPGNDPVNTSGDQSLTGGDDDLDGITTDEIIAAAEAFPPDLGPGVYVLPGRTAAASYLALGPVARERNRLIRPEFPPVATVATVVTALTSYRDSDYYDIIDPLGPRLTIPGLTPGTTRTVSPAVVRGGAECRNDRAGISPNQPAAGEWGLAQYAIAPTITWTDAELDEIEAAGGNVVRIVDGKLRVYGGRTAADPATDPVAVRLGSARLRMGICEVARAEGQKVTFAEIDSGGIVLGDLAGKVEAAINRWQRSLYALDVTASVEDDVEHPGEYLLEIVIEFQAAPDAPRVRVVVARQVTEV